jgi:glycosyltransferase involved in cell wall biosynthesis
MFTIAVPAYNNESTIKNTILSCINQNYNVEYEILIVDNASTDSTQKIVTEFKKEHSNINIMINKKTVSMWENHNNCLRYAKGDYVLFCHTDDVLLPNALKVLHEKIKERNYPHKYVLWGHSMFNDFKPKLDKFSWRVGDYIVGSEAFKIFIVGGLVPSGTCYSRKSFMDIGGFLEDNIIVFPNSDSNTMIKLAFSGFAFEMLDTIIFHREQSSSSYLNKRNKQEELKSYRYLKELLFNYFNDEEIKQILIASTEYQSTFWHSYYIAGSSEYARMAVSKCIKAFLRNPILLRNIFFRKTIIKALRSLY